MSFTSLLILVFTVVSCSYNIFVAGGSYCLFLVLLSVLSSFILMVNSLSFWYCILMLLVYVGGVYILLLFVSIYSYNSFSYSNLIVTLIYILFSSSYLILSDSNFSSELWLHIFSVVSYNDESNMLLSNNNWVSYIFILSVIIISLIIFSFIFSSNSSYIR